MRSDSSGFYSLIIAHWTPPLLDYCRRDLLRRRRLFPQVSSDLGESRKGHVINDTWREVSSLGEFRSKHERKKKKTRVWRSKNTPLATSTSPTPGILPSHDLINFKIKDAPSCQTVRFRYLLNSWYTWRHMITDDYVSMEYLARFDWISVSVVVMVNEVIN